MEQHSYADMDALQDFTLPEIDEACRAAVMANPDRCPNEGHIRGLILKERAAIRASLPKPAAPEPITRTTEERRAINGDWPNWMHKAWQLDREAPGSLYPTEEGTGDGTLSIGTLEGQHLVSWGDWIIQGVKGELYPCKPDIFEATYEAA